MAEHGGKREGSGRKPKAKEIEIIERIDSIGNPDEAIRILFDLVREKNLRAIELLLGYRFGKPKQQTDVTSNGHTLGDFDIKEALNFDNTKR